MHLGCEGWRHRDPENADSHLHTPIHSMSFLNPGLAAIESARQATLAIL